MSPQEAEAMEVRGSLRDAFPPPPPLEELERIALASRPDINSFRVGVSRAEADVKLARANVLQDVYVLYQPYTLQDNTWQGLKSPTSWALGVTIPIPVYNRNQGAILRSKLNVTQTQIQLSSVERAALNDVRQAEQGYHTSLANLRQIETEVLPDADKVLADSKRLFEQGEITVIELLNARRDYNDVARQYLDALVGAPPEHARPEHGAGAADPALTSARPDAGRIGRYPPRVESCRSRSAQDISVLTTLARSPPVSVRL